MGYGSRALRLLIDYYEGKFLSLKENEEEGEGTTAAEINIVPVLHTINCPYISPYRQMTKICLQKLLPLEKTCPRYYVNLTNVLLRNLIMWVCLMV